MTRTIRNKIIFISIVIFFVAIGTQALVTGIYFTKEYAKVRQSETMVIANTLKSQLNRLLNMHIPIDQLVGFEEVCRDVVNQYEHITYVMVVDTDGIILFHNDPANHNQKISEDEIIKTVKSGKRSVLMSSLDGLDHYDIFVPVLDENNKLVAAIRTGFPLSIISEKTKTLALYSAAISLLAFLFGLLLLFVSLNFWVGRPIRKFITTIERITKGGTGSIQHVEITADDEIGKLAMAFNQMTDELKKTTVSKDFMDNILASMLNSLIVLDTKGSIRSVNKETLNLLQYKEQELIGESINKVLIKPETLQDIEKGRQPSMKYLRAIEAVYITSQGDEVPVLFSCNMMRNNNEELLGYICVAQDITEIRTLRGMLPICSSCKKIRDDTGYWNRIETYLRRHSDAEFSHSICPDCAAKLLADYQREEQEKKQKT